MNVSDIAHKTQRTVVDNSPAILTALGVSGVISTAYLAGKAAYAVAAEEVAEVYQGRLYSDMPTKKDLAKKYWRKFIPAAISGTLSVGCIVMANRSSAKRTAVAYSLLTVSEKAYTEYKDKVVQTFGEKKEQAVRDQIAQDHIQANPPPATIILGSGQVICYEEWTGRYFMSDVESLKQAVNVINARMLKHDDATLTDFYHEIGLPVTSGSGLQGWKATKLLELRFSTALTEDKKPCITFEYNYIHSF